MIRSTTLRLAAVWGMGWMAGFALPDEATAQHTPDPYNPWNSQYEQYVFPSYPSGYGVAPNQAILEMPSGRSTSRSFQNYLEDAESDYESRTGSTPSSLSRRTPGVPYYRAYRQFDRAYKRVYTPNEDVDRNYETARRARDLKYSEYLTSADPRERAKLKKEFSTLNQKTQRDLTENRRGSTRRGGSPSPLSTTPEGSPAPPPRRRPLGSPSIEPSAPATGGVTAKPRPNLGAGTSTAPKRNTAADPRKRGSLPGALTAPAETTSPARPNFPSFSR